MNKKNLSVVMAGAMLATSVAPVLAAEKYEVSKSNLGILVDRLDTLFASKKFDENDRTPKGQAKSKFAGTSVYRIQLFYANGTEVTDGADQITVNEKTVNVFKDTTKLLDLVKREKISKVVVYELGSRTDESGRIISTGTLAGNEGTIKTYDEAELKNLVSEYAKAKSGTSTINGLDNVVDNGYVKNIEDNGDKTVTITLSSVNEKYENNTIKLAVGSNELDFTKPVDAKGVSIVGNSDIKETIAGFEAIVEGATKPTDIVGIAEKEAKSLYEVSVASGDIVLDINNLYDGFMLTTEGHDLLNKVNYYKNSFGKSNVTITKDTSDVVKTLTIKLTDNKNNTETIVVKGTNADRITTLESWLNAGKATVDILAGDNRYATAVEIAKTYVNDRYNSNDPVNMAMVNEFVLVNGEALVDGLAAAPYSHKNNAPILLTESNTLPKETKDYLKEFLTTTTVGSIGKKTITIIGGESVVSYNVEKELREIGFTVKRISGDNREETSLAVADKLNSKNQAYVVGADGEADAMSIASHAASINAPIIVSKSTKGLSNVAFNELSEYANVEIIGGESAVSKSDEERIKEVVAKDENVTRIAGANRFETNAKIIKAYHKNFDKVLVAKDGQSKKSELVDALPASLFASVDKVSAPIVLATDKLSNEQLNQIVLNAKKPGTTVYQIGHGVNRTVLETIVTKLGLNK